MVEAVHVDRAGPATAPPVLLLHGWGSSAALMRPLTDALADMFAVFALDLPGHGHSPPPPEPWGIGAHVRLVREVIRKRIHPAHGTVALPVIGHSNGGRIALFLAADPEARALVDRLILISSSGIPRRRSAGVKVRSAIAKLVKTPFTWLPEPVRSPATDWLHHSLLWRALGSSDYRALDGVMRATFVRVVNSYVDDRLDQITAPTLLFWGTNDEAITREQMRRLEDGLPDAGLVPLDGAGHYGYLDAPGPVIAGTRHFLRDYAERAAQARAAASSA